MHCSPGKAAKGLRRPGCEPTASRRRQPMWNNDNPGCPTLNNGAYNPWREARKNSVIFRHRQREEDTRHTPGALDTVLGGITILVLLIGGSALARMPGLLAGHGAQALLLSVIGLCWVLGRRQRAGWRWLCRQGWRGRTLLLVLVLGGLLAGCQDMSRGVLRLTGCDEQAIDYGYCHMPKEVKR